MFRYWAQRERGLKKKKKKKKGSNLNLGGRRTRVQTSILGEEEGSELESRGEEKKGPKWNLRERRRRVRTRLAGEEEGFELESRGEDDSDKRLPEMQLFSLRTDPSLPSLPASLGPIWRAH